MTPHTNEDDIKALLMEFDYSNPDYTSEAFQAVLQTLMAREHDDTCNPFVHYDETKIMTQEEQMLSGAFDHDGETGVLRTDSYQEYD